MSTALTVYDLIGPSSTLATAGNMVGNTTGGTQTNKNTLVGTATGFGEIYSQGNAGAWAAAGSISAPSAHGYLWDVTTLELQQILAGTWTPSLRLKVSAGTATADIYTRFYVRSSGGVYTQIGANFLLSAQSFTSSAATYAFSGQSIAAQNFGVGDKLYQDIWLNITANGTGGGNVDVFASSTAQGTAPMSTITPGFQPNGDQPMAQLWWFSGQ